jgi:hypothetical protein
MIMQENSWSVVFTVACLVSLSGCISEDNTEPLNNTADVMHPLGEICLDGHNNIAMHFHPYLTIIIDGDEYSILGNTGIDTTTCPGAMHMTHTHDTSGKIHVEGNTAEEVPLEVFFDVWGKHFDETGIFDYRDGSIVMTVNGEVSLDYQNLLLEDSQNIVITYTSN